MSKNIIHIYYIFSLSLGSCKGNNSEPKLSGISGHELLANAGCVGQKGSSRRRPVVDWEALSTICGTEMF